MKLLFIGSNSIGFKNKAGFQHLALSALKLNFQVTYIYTGGHLLQKLFKSDYRKQKIDLQPYSIFIDSGMLNYTEINSILFPVYLKQSILDRFENFIFSNLHKFTLPYEEYGEFDYVFVESGHSIVFFQSAYNYYGNKIIYKASDDFDSFYVSSFVRSASINAIRNAMMVTVPNLSMHAKYKLLTDRLFIHEHGVDFVSKESLCRPIEFSKSEYNAVFVGISKLDYKIIEYLAISFKFVNFFIIGPFPDKLKLENVKFMGIVAYELLLNYIAHATVGLCTLELRLNDKNLFNSNKSMLYETYGIPYIERDVGQASNHLKFTYSDSALDIYACFKAALNSILRDPVPAISWSETLLQIIQDAEKTKYQI